jgi:tRNA U34 5-methylaminomethyl-2-thiouridine-forming methyltransferase MnmC
MPSQDFKPILTDDGSITLLHPEFGVTYSSRHGARLQATELYLKLTRTHLHPHPRVLEVGFGLGVNFRVTLQDAMGRGAKLEYLAYERFPVSRALLESVPLVLSPRADRVWRELLELFPDTLYPSPLTLEGEWGRLEIRFEDVTVSAFPHGWATAIYLDPFDPVVNPEPWSLEVLRRLGQAAQPGAYLATYSVAGQLRRDLEAAGFDVRRVDLRQRLPEAKKRFWLQALVPSSET